MKNLILSSLFFSLLFGCQNNDGKIDELEKKIQMQDDAMSKQREQDLEKSLAEKEAELNNLKDKKRDNSNPGFFASGAGLYPEGSQRYLSEGDVAYLSKRDLKIMRNEIFARHGFIFKTNDMMEYFNRQSWYRPLNNDVTNYLSKLEAANVNFIKSYE